MTEEEARKKWCPFARVVAARIDGESVSTTTVRNRLVEIEAGEHQVFAEKLMGCQCIASACMAWRATTTLQAFDRVTGVRLDRPDAIATQNHELRHVATGGYCGLAGAPQ